MYNIHQRCNNISIHRISYHCKPVLAYRYEVKLYRYIKYHDILIYRGLLYNEGQSNYCIVPWCLTSIFGVETKFWINQMVYDTSRKKIDHIYLLKINIHYCLDSSLYHAIYCCIVIHQRQYIDTSTHCIIATLIYISSVSY